MNIGILHKNGCGLQQAEAPVLLLGPFMPDIGRRFHRMPDNLAGFAGTYSRFSEPTVK
jgi:hypothetical protein